MLYGRSSAVEVVLVMVVVTYAGDIILSECLYWRSKLSSFRALGTTLCRDLPGEKLWELFQGRQENLW